MLEHHNSQLAGNATPSLSRRLFLRSAAATATLIVPSAAPTETLAPELPALSDEQQLDNCVAQLRDILARMHPLATKIQPHFHRGREDGSFQFNLQGDVEFQEFDGDGLYEVSNNGYISLWWLEPGIDYSMKSGLPLPGSEFLWGFYFEDGEYVDIPRRMGRHPNILRKIEGGVSPWSECAPIRSETARAGSPPSAALHADGGRHAVSANRSPAPPLGGGANLSGG